jgi:hypothetical protein
MKVSRHQGIKVSRYQGMRDQGIKGQNKQASGCVYACICDILAAVQLQHAGVLVRGKKSTHQYEHETMELVKQIRSFCWEASGMVAQTGEKQYATCLLKSVD